MSNQEREPTRTKYEWKEILERHSSPKNDGRLLEEDTEIIKEAWWQVYSPHPEGPRYFLFEDPEAGESRPITIEDKVRPVNVIEEGYWYAPTRLTQKEVHGKQRTHTEISYVAIAKTPMEAIDKAKKEAFVATRSFARTLLNCEVLLSGKLKFPRQKKPRWVSVQLITDKEREEFEEAARQWLGESGYRIIE